MNAFLPLSNQKTYLGGAVQYSYQIDPSKVIIYLTNKRTYDAKVDITLITNTKQTLQYCPGYIQSSLNINKTQLPAIPLTSITIRPEEILTITCLTPNIADIKVNEYGLPSGQNQQASIGPLPGGIQSGNTGFGINGSTGNTNQPPIGLIQLRTHQTSDWYHPEITYILEANSLIMSSNFPSFGEAYIFIVLPKNILDKKTISITWNVYYSWPDGRDLWLGEVLILNTVLDRKQSLSIGSIKNLFKYVTVTHYPGPLGRDGWLGWRTDYGSVDLSGFGDYVTLVIKLADWWAGQQVNVDVSRLTISGYKDYYFNKNTYTLIMEATGYESYGYLK
jgi:hypothetical protein